MNKDVFHIYGKCYHQSGNYVFDIDTLYKILQTEDLSHKALANRLLREARKIDAAIHRVVIHLVSHIRVEPVPTP